jgi:hypothetical protein
MPATILPCCSYKLEGEPVMQFSLFVSIDGNNSLKCLGTSICGVNYHLYSWTILSGHWLMLEEVDNFKDEVKPHVSTLLLHLTHNNFGHLTSPWTRMMPLMIEKMLMRKLQVSRVLTGGVMEGLKNGRKGFHCSSFIASCHNQLVFLACDMIRSRELYIIDLLVYIFLIESSEGHNMHL